MGNGHGAGGLLRYGFSSWLRSVYEGWSQFWHENRRVFHLDLVGYSTDGPVLDTLHAAVFLQAEQLGYLGWAAEGCNDLLVSLFVHGVNYTPCLGYCQS